MEYGNSVKPRMEGKEGGREGGARKRHVKRWARQGIDFLEPNVCTRMPRYKPPPTLEPNQPHHAAFEKHFHAQVDVENKTVQINQMQLILLQLKYYNFFVYHLPSESLCFRFLKYFYWLLMIQCFFSFSRFSCTAIRSS
jgi:hypothetical protein